MSIQKSPTLNACLGVCLNVLVVNVACADLTKDIEDALNFYQNGNKGAIKMDLNYRRENVDRDAGKDQTANANTARLRLGYLTPTYYDLQAFAEYEGAITPCRKITTVRSMAAASIQRSSTQIAAN